RVGPLRVLSFVSRRRVLAAYAIFAATMMCSMAATAPVQALSLLQPKLVSVGYSGSPTAILGLLPLVGGTLDSRDDALGVLVVKTLDPLGLISLLTGRADVRYAQLDEAVSPSDWSTSTKWSSATADATKWSSSSASATKWSGDDWDATKWSEAGWDATKWSGAGWDSTKWSGSAADGSTSGFGKMDPGVPYQWGLGAINAPGAWLTSVGKMNRVICIVDSGVDLAHPDLAGHLWSAP